MIVFYYSSPPCCTICGLPLKSWNLGQTEGEHLECALEEWRKTIKKICEKHFKDMVKEKQNERTDR